MEIYQVKHMMRKEQRAKPPYKKVDVVERVIRVQKSNTRVGSYFRYLFQWVGKPDCPKS